METKVDTDDGNGSANVPVAQRVRDLEPRIAALREACARTPGVTSLIVFGSTTAAQAERRDEWSDLDFNVFLGPSDADRLGKSWAFLPDPEHIVLTAREGQNGGVVLYDDGLIGEFGAGRPWVVRDPDREVILDGGDILTEAPPPLPDPCDQIGLFLVKLMIGVGRVRRGERIAGGAHIRTYALTPLCEVMRQRLAPGALRNPFDPLRRLESALPEIAHRIEILLDSDVEHCARGMFDLARETLEPGWDEFPARAFGVVARELDWERGA